MNKSIEKINFNKVKKNSIALLHILVYGISESIRCLKNKRVYSIMLKIQLQHFILPKVLKSHTGSAWCLI